MPAGLGPDDVHLGPDGDDIQPGPDDLLLEKRFASGDETALRLVYDRYGPLVYTMCRRSLPSAAADVTQETFVAAWRSRERFDPARGALGAWLATIARNKIIDHVRSDRRQPPRERADDEGLVDGAASPADVESLTDRLVLADALGALAPRARRVVELAYYADLTHEQIAEKCELPLGTVKSDLRRSLPRLARHLRLSGGGTDG